MLTDQDVAHLRANAVRVRDALHRIITRVPPGGPALPSELTCKLTHHAADLRFTGAEFVAMACTAVQRKYEAAGHAQLTLVLAQLRDMALHPVPFDCHQRRSEYDAHHANLRRQLTVFRKRLGAHATRVELGDPDLHLCLAMPRRGLAYSTTAWVCQQPDLRYRWTPTGMTRLHFMAHCWDNYARCDFTAADALIGLHDFPLSDTLRPDPCP